MPNPPSPLSINVDRSSKSPTTATRSTSEINFGTNGSSHVKDQIASDAYSENGDLRKSHNSPSSPRAFKGLFSSKTDKSDKKPAVRHGGPTSSFSTSDLNRTVPIVRPYAPGSNDSAGSLGRTNVADETASTRSAASGIPESIRSDDEVNRLKSSSSSNVAEHSSYRKEQKAPLPSNLGRRPSQRSNQAPTQIQNQNLKPTIQQRQREDSDPKTAPLRTERGFQEALRAQQYRNRSADRSAVESEDEGFGPHKSSSFSTSQQSFLSNFKHHGARAADGLGKAGKGLFGKFNRSGSSNEKEASTYHPGVPQRLETIVLPLELQTKKTRIRKTMDLARDKTEYWMPALPYRCIDYLNHHGVESEGLYRIPGSVKDINMLQGRFDNRPYDVDLLEPPNEPADINAVASMFKGWLRSLPSEIIPEAIQSRIEKVIEQECGDLENNARAPKQFRDELSNLPPYNYYLLFAVTCHLSLLHSHAEVNKMTFSNLNVCIRHSLKINHNIFLLLIKDWRNCWQGCWTESEYLQREISEQQMPPPVFPQRSDDPPSQPNSRPNTSRSPERRQPMPPPPPPVSSPAEGGHQSPAAQPFAQDLGGKMFSSRQQSPPPKIDPIQNIPAMRM